MAEGARQPRLHVLVAGGGTAGHVEPAMALADAVVRRVPTAQVTALGTAYGLEATLVPSRGYAIHMIPRVPMPRKPSIAVATLPARLFKAIRAAGEVFAKTKPDVVVGFGGYVALPAYLAARKAKIPIVVHEANAKPGMANRVGARLTPFVAVSSSVAQLPHGRLIGIPLRRSIAVLERSESRLKAREAFGLDLERPTLLVFGGSQGARSINRALNSALPQLRSRGIQVLHAVGPDNLTGRTEEFSAYDAPYVQVAYLEDMDLAYAAADLAVCRSGAMTCAELAAVGLPAVFVPYPHSNGEQELNALPMMQRGAGLMLADDRLDGSTILDAVIPVLTDPERLHLMGLNAATLGMQDADERLADLVLEAARYQ